MVDTIEYAKQNIIEYAKQNNYFKYVKQHNYFQEGAVGALAFTTIMNLGASPKMMKGVLGGAVVAAGANIFLNKNNPNGTHKTSDHKQGEALATGVITARIWEGFSRASDMVKGMIVKGYLGEIKLNCATTCEIVGQDYLDKLEVDACYHSFDNLIQVSKNEMHSSAAVHEWVHARWRNARVRLFGAKAIIHSSVYYQISQILDSNFRQIPRLSWYLSGVETYVEGITVLKAPFDWKNRRVGFSSRLINLAHCLPIFLIGVVPLVFLMQQAAEGAGLTFNKKSPKALAEKNTH